MWNLFLFFALCTNPIPHKEIDRNASSYEMRERKRVEVFDFSGPFAHLKNIDIDARRKKFVEFDLSGDYPLLESVNYAGTFGTLKGKLTGNYPLLEEISFMCGSTAINLDLHGAWNKDCVISIHGVREDVVLKLPDNVNLNIHAKTSVKGKIIASADLKKKGWGIWKKTFICQRDETLPLLTIHVEVEDAKIYLE